MDFNFNEYDEFLQNVFGPRLDYAREKRGYKGKELAKLLNTTPQTVSNWLGRISFPSGKHLFMIGEVLKLDLRYFTEENSSFEDCDLYAQERTYSEKKKLMLEVMVDNPSSMSTIQLDLVKTIINANEVQLKTLKKLVEVAIPEGAKNEKI